MIGGLELTRSAARLVAISAQQSEVTAVGRHQCGVDCAIERRQQDLVMDNEIHQMQIRHLAMAGQSTKVDSGFSASRTKPNSVTGVVA